MGDNDMPAAMVAILDSEWGIIFVLIAVVILFGSSKLPKFARSLGSAQSEFKKGLAEGSKDGDPKASEEDTPAVEEQKPPSIEQTTTTTLEQKIASLEHKIADMEHKAPSPESADAHKE